MHLIVPAEELERNPWKNSVALLPLREAAKLQQGGEVPLPGGAGRFAVTVDGTESEEEVAALKVPIQLNTHVYMFLVTCLVIANKDPGGGTSGEKMMNNVSKRSCRRWRCCNTQKGGAALG